MGQITYRFKVTLGRQGTHLLHLDLHAALEPRNSIENDAFGPPDIFQVGRLALKVHAYRGRDRLLEGVVHVAPHQGRLAYSTPL